MKTASLLGELLELSRPVWRRLDSAWRQLHWAVLLMGVLYAVSGTTIVKPDEVAIVLRWGAFVGSDVGVTQHGPGLLFALPPPIDEVLTVPSKHSYDLTVQTLAAKTGGVRSTLDPLEDGYALTGDQNIVQTSIVAHYVIANPAAWALLGAKADDLVRIETTAAMRLALAAISVDEALSTGRKRLIEEATRTAQAGLDQAQTGLSLTSLELKALGPPAALVRDFEAVHAAFIGAETARRDAETQAQTLVARAQRGSDSGLQEARGSASEVVSQAKAEADVFLDLAAELKNNPGIIRERLYREGVEKAIAGAQSVRWIPGPAGSRYEGLRISVRDVRAPGTDELPLPDSQRSPPAPASGPPVSPSPVRPTTRAPDISDGEP